MATDPSMDNSISTIETLLRRQARFSTSVEETRTRSDGSHTIECCCSRCERDCSGYSAQQAALAGDPHAAQGLTPTVVAALAACAPGIVTAQAEQTTPAPEGQPNFGAWLRARRTQAGVSRQELAHESGLTWHVLTKIEAGRLWRHSEIRDCLIAALNRLMLKGHAVDARG